MGIRQLSLKTILPYLKAVWATSPLACTTAFIFLLLGGLFEGAGLLLLVPVLKFIGVGAEQPEQTGIIEKFSTLFESLGLETNPSLLLALVFGILFLRALILYVGTHITSFLESQFLHNQRAETYQALSSASWSFLSRQSTSKMTHVVTLQSENVAAGAEYAVQFGAVILSLIVGISLAALLSPKLTVIIIIIGGIIFLIMNFFNHRTTRIAQDENDKTAALFQQIESHFSSLKAVKLMASGTEMTGKFLTNSKLLSAANRDASNNHAQAVLFFQTASAGFLILIVYLAIQFFPNQSLETILLIVIFSRLAPRANGAMSYLRSLLAVVVEFDRSESLVNAAKNHSSKITATCNRMKLKHSLIFRDVGFEFPDSGRKRQLHNLNLTVKVGTTLGIIGQSGEGKTTLVDLMCGLLPPTKGTILFDGVALDENHSRDWLANTVYVPQDDYLFEGTVAENLLVAAPQSNTEDLWLALKNAGIEEFVRNSPNGLDTKVGSHGVQLSRGQRQRLCLARGLLRSPSFLVLDEALNALSPADEIDILVTLRSIPTITNLVIVSHRVSSVKWVDNIILIQDGTITNQGTFEELSKPEMNITHAMLQPNMPLKVNRST